MAPAPGLGLGAVATAGAELKLIPRARGRPKPARRPPSLPAPTPLLYTLLLPLRGAQKGARGLDTKGSKAKANAPRARALFPREARELLRVRI